MTKDSEWVNATYIVSRQTRAFIGATECQPQGFQCHI